MVSDAQPGADEDTEFDAALEAFGLQASDDDQSTSNTAADTFWLWPECVPVWALWLDVQTQWRYAGMDAQRAGLDYTAVSGWARGVSGLRGVDYIDAMRCIQVMERAAMGVWANQRAST